MGIADRSRRDKVFGLGSLRPDPWTVSKSGKGRTVLVVEDKPNVRALFVRMLATIDCTVVAAASLAEAAGVMARTIPDVIVLGLRLPDSDELQTLEAVFAHGSRSQVIIVSGFLTTDLTVKAVKLGAQQVLEKPVLERPFLEAVMKALATAASMPTDVVPMADRTQGAAAHFVSLVLRALDSDRDLKTLGVWAKHVGLSDTMLRLACYRAQLKQPHNARDFARVLLAVVRARKHGCDLALLLDIADTRTLGPLLAWAGLTGRTTGISVQEFLERQQFIPADHEVLRLLREALKR